MATRPSGGARRSSGRQGRKSCTQPAPSRGSAGAEAMSLPPGRRGEPPAAEGGPGHGHGHGGGGRAAAALPRPVPAR